VLSSSSDVGELVLIDAVEDRVGALARACPGARTFTSLSSALDTVDAVVIATPPTTHARLALEAIDAGKHVLVEKPMTIDTCEARTLIDAADAAGVTLMVGHTFEYNAAVWKLRELVTGGELGDLYYIDTARLNLGLYQNDVNVVYDLAPHDISIANYLLGRPPDAVEAWAARHADPRFEDVAYLRLFYDGSASANIHVSWLDPCKVRRVTAVGSRKMAVYNDLAGDDRIRVHDKGVVLEHLDGALTQPPMSYRYGDIISPYITFKEPLQLEAADFLHSAATGARPQTDAASGLAVVRTLQAAQLSLTERRVVLLDEVDGVCGHLHGSPPTDRRTPVGAETR
jgi:predicted dehydrogenase